MKNFENGVLDNFRKTKDHFDREEINEKYDAIRQKKKFENQNLHPLEANIEHIYRMPRNYIVDYENVIKEIDKKQMKSLI